MTNIEEAAQGVAEDFSPIEREVIALKAITDVLDTPRGSREGSKVNAGKSHAEERTTYCPPPVGCGRCC